MKALVCLITFVLTIGIKESANAQGFDAEAAVAGSSVALLPSSWNPNLAVAMSKIIQDTFKWGSENFGWKQNEEVERAYEEADSVSFVQSFMPLTVKRGLQRILTRTGNALNRIYNEENGIVNEKPQEGLPTAYDENSEEDQLDLFPFSNNDYSSNPFVVRPSWTSQTNPAIARPRNANRYTWNTYQNYPPMPKPFPIDQPFPSFNHPFPAYQPLPMQQNRYTVPSPPMANPFPINRPFPQFNRPFPMNPPFPLNRPFPFPNAQQHYSPLNQALPPFPSSYYYRPYPPSLHFDSDQNVKDSEESPASIPFAHHHQYPSSGNPPTDEFQQPEDVANSKLDNTIEAENVASSDNNGSDVTDGVDGKKESSSSEETTEQPNENENENTTESLSDEDDGSETTEEALSDEDDGSGTTEEALSDEDDGSEATEEALSDEDDGSGTTDEALSDEDDGTEATEEALSDEDDGSETTEGPLSDEDDGSEATEGSLSDEDDGNEATEESLSDEDDATEEA
jgi:hypothetical protein